MQDLFRTGAETITKWTDGDHKEVISFHRLLRLFAMVQNSAEYPLLLRQETETHLGNLHPILPPLK
jgi:hypothetical protein